MNFLRRYFWMGAVIAIALILKLQNFTGTFQEIRPFRGAALSNEVFSPRIASSVNSAPITLTVDGSSTESPETALYMDDSRNLMVPVDSLRDSFRCSAKLYRGEVLRLLKSNRQIEFSLGQSGYVLDGDAVNGSASMVEKDGECFVPASLLAESLGYTYEWDIEQNTATLVGSGENEPIYPSKFSLVEEGRNPTVREQGSLDTCWAFASLSALESTLRPEEEVVFSANHMTLENAFHTGQERGGDYTMSMAYLAGWQGPVYESDDPYQSKVDGSSLPPVRHVQEIRIIDSKNFEGIKEAVFLYGGVETSIYNDLKNKDSESPYYNRATASYCYIGTEKPNHDVVIVGWDDDYPKENFTEELEGDGAFLCQNSWGERFGNHGLFYISYYDTNVGTHNVVYTGIEEPDNYDRICQTDLCGWVGQIGYGLENSLGANIYTAGKKEELGAAGFYATGKGSTYRLYVVHDFAETSDFSRKVQIAEGSLTYGGYYTVRPEVPVEFADDEQFAVVLELRTPGSTRPLAVEYAADEMSEAVDLTDGTGYISMNGHYWDSIEDAFHCNLCLKAYLNQK